MTSVSYDDYMDLLDASVFGEWWYESTAQQLIDLAEGFEDSDWQALALAVENMSADNQEMCLYTIVDASAPWTIKISWDLLASDNRAVSQQALSAINECLDVVDVSLIDDRLKSKLKSIIPQSAVEHAIFKKLRDKF